MNTNRFIYFCIVIVLFIFFAQGMNYHLENEKRLDSLDVKFENEIDTTPWMGSNSALLPLNGPDASIIRYGYQLVRNTSRFLGPKGIVLHNNNAMNCQNCHLDAGTKPFGNNFGKVFSTYPQYRSRNDGVQTLMMRLQDCFKRSMNGNALDSTSKEMRAIYAYIHWLDDGVKKGRKPIGTKMPLLPYLDRAASPEKGMKIYITNCAVCHGKDGQGQLNELKDGFTYPPLWGSNSFNDGAGLSRIGNLASFIHYNMPLGTKYDQPNISAEDSWDIAAFILSKTRPHFDQSKDYKILKKKPVDDPFGPYLDRFSPTQHKYGPFPPIKEFYKSINKKNEKVN